MTALTGSQSIRSRPSIGAVRNNKNVFSVYYNLLQIFVTEERDGADTATRMLLGGDLFGDLMPS